MSLILVRVLLAISGRSSVSLENVRRGSAVQQLAIDGARFKDASDSTYYYCQRVGRNINEADV